MDCIRNCLPKVLIDNEDLPNVEESDDDDKMNTMMTLSKRMTLHMTILMMMTKMRLLFVTAAK